MAKKQKTATVERQLLPHETMFDMTAFKAEKEKLEAKYLAGVREERDKIMEQRRGIDARLTELNGIENEITGRRMSVGPSGGRRARMSADDKVAVAKVLYGKMAESKMNKFGGGELGQFTGGLPVAALVALWNETPLVKTDKAQAIHSEGKKGGKKYWVA